MNLTTPQTGLESVTELPLNRRCARRLSFANLAELHFTQTRLHRLSVVVLSLAASLANGEPIPARPADALDVIKLQKSLAESGVKFCLRFASPMASVRQYLPNQSDAPVNTSQRVSAVDLSMDARLNLLEIQP
jgi:hypothetical protein